MVFNQNKMKTVLCSIPSLQGRSLQHILLYFPLHTFRYYIRIRSPVGAEYVQAPSLQYFTSQLGQTLLLLSNNSCNGLHTTLLLINFVFGLITLVFCTLCCIIIHSASWLEPAMFHNTNFVLIIYIILIKFMALIK